MPAEGARTPPRGVLIADKPRGLSSFKVVSEVRRQLRIKSVGHAGTLDPMATGVLVVLVGEATKLSNYLTQQDKRYVAAVTLGTATDTLDAEGQVVERVAPSADWFDRARLEAALASERLRTQQVPPAHSAIKVAGRRAYALARKGATLELAPRAVSVKELSLLSFEGNTLRLELAVSKGYYVRALARDLGHALGIPAHLSGLVRTASGPFRLEEARSWPFEAPLSLMGLEQAARRALPAATLTADGVTRARAGQALSDADFSDLQADAATAAWYDGAGRLVALGKRDGDSLRVRRGFNPPPER
jgi:tRNA pseudouridine55 synthase